MDICTVDILKSYLSRKVSVISKQSLYFIYYVDSKTTKQNKKPQKKKKCLNYSRTFWDGGEWGWRDGEGRFQHFKQPNYFVRKLPAVPLGCNICLFLLLEDDVHCYFYIAWGM